MKNITLYGRWGCHKTQHYMRVLKSWGLGFTFKDVIENEEYATELRSLYQTGRLNFPTLMIKDKKLRNPSDEELKKWLIKKDLLSK